MITNIPLKDKIRKPAFSTSFIFCPEYDHYQYSTAVLSSDHLEPINILIVIDLD